MTASGALGPFAKAALAAEIVVAYVRSRRAVRHRELPAALVTLRTVSGDEQPMVADADPARLSRAVQRTLARVPARSRCLMWSLVLTRLLARRGVAGTVVIGVRPGADFGAHAWVEVGGRPVLPAGGTEFSRLVEL